MSVPFRLSSVRRAVVAPAASPVWRVRIGTYWPVGLGLVVVAVPSAGDLFALAWQDDVGPLEILVALVSAVLLVRAWPAMRAAARPAPAAIGLPLLALALVLHILGRLAGYVLVESAGAYAALLATLYLLIGVAAMRPHAFILLYPILSLPLEPALRPATVGLRFTICRCAVALLHACGYPVGAMGQVIFVDSYALALEDACSGMASLFTLSAVGLLYVYLQRGARGRYLAATFAVSIALAILANFARVCILVLMTHYLGDGVAQSLFHQATGLVMFAIALGGVMLFDRLAWPLQRRARG